MQSSDDPYGDEAVARRTDETIKRMLATPPQPRTTKATGTKMGRPKKQPAPKAVG